MGSWQNRLFTSLALCVFAGVAIAAVVLAWNKDARTTMQRLAPPAPVPRTAQHADPLPQDLPTKCQAPNAVLISSAQAWSNDPRPELSVRTNSKIGRGRPIELALIVDTDGRVICADAVAGFPAYHARAEELAMLWRFKPFMRDGRPVTARVYRQIPIRWLDNRPPKRVPFPPINDWHSLRISLSRSSCFGTCPDYEIQIDGNGNVTYNGTAFVALLGRHRAHISQEAVRNLFDQFRRADFFWLHDGYSATITDGASYTLELAYDGNAKRVQDYMGLVVSMPDAVTNLEYAIDDATDSARWTKGNENTARSLTAEGWNFKSRSRENLAIAAGLARYGEPSALRAVIALGAPVTAAVDAEQSHFEPDAKITALDAAIERGEPRVLQILLSAARWPRAALNNSLFFAALYGRMAIVAPLLRAGADPHYASPPATMPPGEQYPGPGVGSRTVLMNAAGSRMPDVVEAILATKPDVQARDEYGWTAIHYAVAAGGPSYGDEEEYTATPDLARTIELLVAAGADLNARTKSGKTALALSEHDPDAKRVLLEAGAR